MTNSIFDRFSSTDTASVQRKQRKQKQGRILRIEELENRKLLSVSPWNAVIPVSFSPMTQWEDSTDANTQVIVSSASASVMSAASVAISAVTGLTATDRTHQSITVEWNEVSDAAGYELRYSMYDLWSSRREWTVVSDITDATFIVNGLQSRTYYEIQVRAVAENTLSDWRYVTAHTTYFVPTPADLSVSVGEMSNHIFGRSATVFYNTSAGSDMFIGVTDTWAYGHSLGLTDGRLVMRMSGGTGSRGYVFDDWTEAEVLGIAEYVQQTYDILGNYRFFTGFGFPDRQASVSLIAYISRVGSVDGYADIASGSLMAFQSEGTPSYSTFVHEVAHFWHNQNRNPIWSDFHSISWDGSEQYEEDFAHWYGMNNAYEDWATTVANVVTGFSGGSSDKWHQKVDMIHQFFAWLNPNYVRQSDTPDVPGAVDEPTDEPSVDIPPVEEPIEEEPVDTPVAPAASTDMRIDESAPYSVVLQWTQSDEVSSYVLEYRRTSDTEGEWIEITTPVAAATSVCIEGLKPVTQYTFRLTAVNDAGTAATEMTAATTANPDALLPVKPRVQLDKKATTTTSLTINLSAPNGRTSLDANVHYTINWSPTGRNSTAPSGHVDGVTGTQFTLKDLNPGTRYRITFTPHNENGQSHDSRNRSMHTSINATTQRYDTLRVQKLRSDNALRTADSLTFTWQQSRAKHVADAVTHYRIEVLDRTTGQTVMQTTTTDLRFTLTELDANTRYTIRMQEVATIDGRDILSRIAQLTARTLRLV